MHTRPTVVSTISELQLSALSVYRSLDTHYLFSPRHPTRYNSNPCAQAADAVRQTVRRPPSPSISLPLYVLRNSVIAVLPLCPTRRTT